MIKEKQKWQLLLLAAFLLQVWFFNSNLVYGVRLELFWVVFIASAHKFRNTELPLMAVVFAWLNSIFLINNGLSLLLFGLTVGLVLSFVTVKPIWSLVWFRTVFSVFTLIIFEIIVSIQTLFDGGFLLKLGLFTVVHLVLAFVASNLIIETVDE